MEDKGEYFNISLEQLIACAQTADAEEKDNMPSPTPN